MDNETLTLLVDTVVGLIGPLCGLLMLFILYRFAKRPKQSLHDVLVLVGGFGFWAIFLQLAHIKMQEFKLHWIDFFHLQDDMYAEVLGSAFLTASFVFCFLIFAAVHLGAAIEKIDRR